MKHLQAALEKPSLSLQLYASGLELPPGQRVEEMMQAQRVGTMKALLGAAARASERLEVVLEALGSDGEVLVGQVGPMGEMDAFSR